MEATKTQKKATWTHDQWVAEGYRRFGRDTSQWRFVCPSCGHVATVQDWEDAGAPEGAIALSCVGRWKPGTKQARSAFGQDGGPCNYAGGGLIGMNPVDVEFNGSIMHVFEFAPKEKP